MHVGGIGSQIGEAAHRAAGAGSLSRDVGVQVDPVTPADLGDQRQLLGYLEYPVKGRRVVLGCSLNKAVKDVPVSGSGPGQHSPAGAEALGGHEPKEFLAPVGTGFRFFGTRHPIRYPAEHPQNVPVAFLHVLAAGNRLRMVVEMSWFKLHRCLLADRRGQSR